MGAYDVRERPYRARNFRGAQNVRGSQPQGDCITIALTAQAILCALLILLVFIIKKADGSLYSRIKAQCGEMQGSASRIDFNEAFGWIFDGAFDGGDSVLDKAKRLAEDFFSAKPATEGESGYEPESEPESGSEIPETYDYLGDIPAGLTGSGGLMPTGSGGGLLSAPPGSNLSPVYLSARVKPPVTGVITSSFSYRYHPLSGESDFHTGLDIAAEEGRAILAALPGEVSEVGENEIYGKYIVLKHATNLLTSYSHCSEIIAREGMAVRQGERIAKVGQTGVATGPHLHFSVIVEGQFVDPQWVLSDSIKLVEQA